MLPVAYFLISFTIKNLNLANNAEVMLRWKYTLDNTTNGNGLAIDDVTVTPESSIFYVNSAGPLNLVSSWGANIDGSGTPPVDFTTADQIFYLMQGTDSLGTRMPADWLLGGTNSKLIIGDGQNPVMFTVPPTVNFTGTVDVADYGTLNIMNMSSTASNGGTGPVLKLGSMDNLSTVRYAGTSTGNGTSTEQKLQAVAYGNLVLSGGTVSTPVVKFLGRDIIVNGDLRLAPYTKLNMFGSSLSLEKSHKIRGAGNTSYLYFDPANTTGLNESYLRLTVPKNGVTGTIFPVGTAASYNPLILQQTASGAEDVFSVLVKDGLYSAYTNTTGTTGSGITFKAVNKTWFVVEEVLGGTNADMTLQWNNLTDVTADFIPTDAHINHYTGSGWDRYTSPHATTTVATNTYAQTRMGITSFSPFAVSSREDGVLPVELVAFDARRTAETVLCTWTTASEKNNAYFAVERSLDGKAFQRIGTVEGNGTSSQAYTYRFSDKHPPIGITYYRLRQVDQDGQESWAPIVAVKACADCIAATPAISIAPNPGAGRFELWTNLAEAGVLQATVLSIIGTPVLTQKWSVVAGNQHIPLDLVNQPAGVYIVQLATPTGPVNVRVVKQ